jgi:hypothetical protein
VKAGSFSGKESGWLTPKTERGEWLLKEDNSLEEIV